MKRFIPVLLVPMAIALGGCSASSQTATTPIGVPVAKSAGVTQRPTSANSATQPVSPNGGAVTSSAVTVPRGKVGKACLLTIDQAAEAMGTKVKVVEAGNGGKTWDAECFYDAYSAADIAAAKRLPPEQGIALLATLQQIHMLLGCGPDSLSGLPIYPPIPDSPVPGALGPPDIPGIAFAPLSGGCILGVTLGGVNDWDKSKQKATVLNILKVSVAGWKG